MSTARMDYVPFDYLRYTREIVPALQQATQGNGQPLQALIEQARQFSLWPRLNRYVPLTKDEMPRWSAIEGLLDVATLRRVKAGDKLNPWDFLPKVIPTLVGRDMKNLGSFGDLLRVCLLYTFCCEMPPETKEPTFILGDEPVFEWHEYISRDEGAKAPQRAFARPAPSLLASQLHISIPDNSDNIPTHLPRNLGYGAYEHLIGFITLEEGQDLLACVQTHEAPRLWWIEDEVLRRVQFAVSRGWAILEIWD
jgi:hypothetical protein